MPSAVHVPGACRVRVDTGAARALEELGYSENGVFIQEETFFGDVKGDQNGGEEGPPIDVQYFGEIHRVRMELSLWDSAIAAKVLPVLYGGTEGIAGTPGSLLAAGGFTYRLLLHSTNLPRNYLRAFLRGAPKEINKGTKYSRLVLNWECHANGIAGTLYNTTVT